MYPVALILEPETLFFAAGYCGRGGDFSEHPFPPLALIYSLAYVAHVPWQCTF